MMAASCTPHKDQAHVLVLDLTCTGGCSSAPYLWRIMGHRGRSSGPDAECNVSGRF